MTGPPTVRSGCPISSPEPAVEAAVEAVGERDVRYRSRGRRGQAALRDVPLRTRLRMAGLMGRAARGVVTDVLRRGASGS